MKGIHNKDKIKWLNPITRVSSDCFSVRGKIVHNRLENEFDKVFVLIKQKLSVELYQLLQVGCYENAPHGHENSLENRIPFYFFHKNITICVGFACDTFSEDTKFLK